MSRRHKAEVEGRHSEAVNDSKRPWIAPDACGDLCSALLPSCSGIPVVAALLATIRRRGADRSRWETTTTESFRAKTRTHHMNRRERTKRIAVKRRALQLGFKRSANISTRCKQKNSRRQANSRVLGAKGKENLHVPGKSFTSQQLLSMIDSCGNLFWCPEVSGRKGRSSECLADLFRASSVLGH
ncbi:hypothetical protein Aduo_015887 [Ancylostoma duodenale]